MGRGESLLLLPECVSTLVFPISWDFGFRTNLNNLEVEELLALLYQILRVVLILSRYEEKVDVRGFGKIFLILFETFDGQPHSYTIYSPLCNLEDQVQHGLLIMGRLIPIWCRGECFFVFLLTGV